MPVDISHLSIKANLKGTKAKAGSEKDNLKRMYKAQESTLKKVQVMLLDFVPMVREDFYDRLNR